MSIRISYLVNDHQLVKPSLGFQCVINSTGVYEPPFDLMTVPPFSDVVPYLHGEQSNKNARELMDELRTDCKDLSDIIPAQEITTILRDRLTTLSSDLIEARSRI